MAQASLQTYLFFNGNCEQAMAYYAKAIGAELEMLMRYSESPEAPPPGMVPPGFEEKVMHASLRIKDSVLMASDDCAGTGGPRGMALSLRCDNAQEADAAFAALSAGGSVQMPMGKTFFSERFGMLTDRFGVMWMITL